MCAHGIKSCFVGLDVNMAVECRAWLDANDPIQPNINNARALSNRRKSVAGTSMYSVGDEILETGCDYLPKIPRCSGSSGKSPIATASGIIDRNSLVAGAVPTPTSIGNQESVGKFDSTGVASISHRDPVDTSKKPVPDLILVAGNAQKKITSVSTIGFNQAAAMSHCEVFRGDHMLRKNTDDIHFNGSVQPVQPLPVRSILGQLSAGNPNATIRNNFDPFRRSANVPFSIHGRPRVKSVDSVHQLPTIHETPQPAPLPDQSGDGSDNEIDRIIEKWVKRVENYEY